MDSLDITRFFSAFIFVVGLIAGLGYVIRRYGNTQKWLGAGKSDGRLSVVEVRYLDPKRRLVLIKRDNTEHLLLLSDGKDMVIESPVSNHG
ncbi:MAG: flagellar biosynthetic protein FliO [Rickettsiales bacterium]|nr:flagellar biosynthetic protein FliO [Rickettsiales bacterium]